MFGVETIGAAFSVCISNATGPGGGTAASCPVFKGCNTFTAMVGDGGSTDHDTALPLSLAANNEAVDLVRHGHVNGDIDAVLCEATVRLFCWTETRGALVGSCWLSSLG